LSKSVVDADRIRRDSSRKSRIHTAVHLRYDFFVLAPLKVAEFRVEGPLAGAGGNNHTTYPAPPSPPAMVAALAHALAPAPAPTDEENDPWKPD
jgi:hypothetical protein